MTFALRRRYNVGFYVFCAVVSVIFSTFSDREIQYFAPSTSEAYETWLRRRNLSPQTQPLESAGGKLLWIGNRETASKVVLFFHGGGYVAPALEGHFEWCWNAYVKAGEEHGEGVAVAVLHYTLLVKGRFPVTLQQAAAGLGEILDSGVHPSDIIVGGDSAGGNLTMQLVCHLLHPRDDVRRIELTAPLAGIFLVSPFLSNNFQRPSHTENEGVDMVSASSLNAIGNLLYGADRVQAHLAEIKAGDYSASNAYETPLDADESWLDDIASTASRIYVTVGKHEVLRDQGVALVTLLMKQHANVEIRLEITPGEAHDFILLENMFNQVGDATNRMKDWFCAACRED